MGFVGIFNLALRCFDLLAWPLLALGYPLRASIMAIEANSELDMRKLVTYWIIFSLISLFEHAFVKLLEWIPLWLYIKLMIVCWLVIPHFDGSYYIYMHVVRPCLSIETQTVIKQLKNLKEISFESKDLSLKGENFIDEVEKFVRENGPEALEKLIASKAKLKEDVVQKDIKAVEATKELKADVAKPAFQTKVKSAEVDNIITHAPVEIKEVPSATSMGVEVPDPDQVQKEWACTVCQVTITSENALNVHLQGRRHKKKLNAQNQNSNPPSVKNKSSVPKFKPQKGVASSTEGHNVKPNDIKAVEAKEEIKADVAKPCSKITVEIKEEPSATSMGVEVPHPDLVQEEWDSGVPQLTRRQRRKKLNAQNQKEVEIKEEPSATSMGVEVPHPDLVQEESDAGVPLLTRRQRRKKLNAQNQNSKTKVPPAPVKNNSSVPIVKPENSVASSSEGHNVKLDGIATTSHGRCFICNVEFYSMQHMHTHFKGKPHLSRISELNGVPGGVHFENLWKQEY